MEEGERTEAGGGESPGPPPEPTWGPQPPFTSASPPLPPAPPLPGAYPPPQWPNPPMLPTPPTARPLRLLLLVLLLLVCAAGAGLYAGRLSISPSERRVRIVSPPSSPFFGGLGGGGITNGRTPRPGGSTGVGAGGSSLNAHAIAAKVDPGLVDVNVILGYQGIAAAGTGIVLTPNGEILTNNHLVDGATTIRATDIGNGKTYSARVLGTDPTTDLAVIQLRDASHLVTVKLGNSHRADRGEPVLAIGNAGGAGGIPSTAAGSIVALHQAIVATDDAGEFPEHLRGLIESTAPIEPGDSGGPLVDASGHVLAIDTAATAGGELPSHETAAYSIPIDAALAIATEIVAGSHAPGIEIGVRGVIGVVVVTSSGATHGALVESVVPGSPAVSSGIQPGDVIVSVNGKSVSSETGLTGDMLGRRPGSGVKLGLVTTSGLRRTVHVVLAAGPPA